jgi:hypothetical protein
MEDMSTEEVLTFLKDEFPNTIISLHDISSKRRKSSRQLLRSLCERANAEYKLQEALVSSAVACLAGSSEGIRAGVVEFLGLCAYALEDCEELKKRFTRIVLLLENRTPQISRSMIKFLRLAAQGLRDPDAQTECIEYFVKSIMGSRMARSACRIRIRTVIEKFGKRFGWDQFERMLPEEHLRLFRYTKRMYKRRVRQAKARDLKDDMSDFDDSENEDDDASSASSEEEEEIVMREDDERPIDLMSNRVPLVRKRDIVKKKTSSSAKIHSDGRLIVEDEESNELVTAQPKRMCLADLAELRDKSNAMKKAKMAERGSVGSLKSNSKKMKDSKRLRRKHELTGLTQFAPKKAHAFGDAKRSQQETDPFAYVRLNPSLIREKYKGNAIKSLSQVVRKTGEKASRKRVLPGRGGVAGNMFVQKPSFKKPHVERPKTRGSRK